MLKFLEAFMFYIYGVASGVAIAILTFIGTHNCYSTLGGAGLICSTHSFSFDFLFH